MGCSTFSEYTVLHEESAAKIDPKAPLEKVSANNKAQEPLHPRASNLPSFVTIPILTVGGTTPILY